MTVTVGGGHDLVGRAPEWRRLAAALSPTGQDRATVVVVDGEPGVGKTSLVRGVLRGCSSRVIAVSGDLAEQGLEWGVIDQIERSLDPLARPARPDAAGMGRALADALARAAADGPVAVVVDDAHWGDPPSLRALAFSARSVGAAPVTICLTCTTGGVDALPAALVGQAEAAGTRLTLGPLDRAAVCELAERAYGQVLTPGATERLHAHTGGNPLHTMAVLRELDLATVSGPHALPAPRSYSALVSARLAECSADARRLAGALAVIAREASLRDVGAAAGVADVSGPVGELIDAGLVVPGRGDDRPSIDEAPLRFAHPLIRVCIHDGLPPSELAELHRGAAVVTSGDAQLRHRLAAAVGPDPELVAAATARAGDLGAEGAPGAAARLRVAAAPAAAPAERDELLLSAAVELMQTGEPLGRLVDDVFSLPDSARRSLVLGREALHGGRREEAGAWLQRAWDQASAPHETSLRPAIADLLSLAALNDGRWHDVGTWAEQAVDLGSASGLSATLLAHALVLTRRSADAERRLSSLAEDPALHPLRALDALVGRGVARLWADDLDGAADDLRVAAGRLADDGLLIARAEIDAHRAEVALRSGDWTDALALATSAAAVVDDADAVWLGALAHGVVAFVHAARGDLVVADRHAAMATACARDTGLMAARLWAHHAAMRVAAAAADHDTLARLGDRMAHEGWGSVPEGVHHWRAAYAESLIALDRIDDAARVAVELETEARAGAGDLSIAADAARAQGLVASAERRDDEATAVFDRGLALDAVRSRPLERARLELAAGAHLRRVGRRRAAADVLGAAADRLAALGAAPWLERCRDELAACGLHPRRGGEGPPELTARERLVAAVVARGRSNREVAAELGITVKTVEHHLGRIYAKLGVRSRSQLVVHLAGDAAGDPASVPEPSGETR